MSDMSVHADPVIWYCQSARGFFVAGIHTVPAAALPITLEEYTALLAAQSSGATIEPDATGRPVAVYPPAPTLADLRAAADTTLTAACADAIVAGVVCDALGAPHTYPTEPTDQANLNGAVTFSLLPDTPVDWQQPLTCRDAAGTWGRRLHDRAQLYTVAAAVVAHIDTCRARLAVLRAQLAAATDSAAIAAITW